MHIIAFLSVSVLFLQAVISETIPNVPKIAIIGGGIGGTSCAYFLKQLFEDKVSVTLFERDTVGGRLRVLNVDGEKYEAGGSVIHPKNKYMADFAKDLGLGVRQPQSRKLGIYDGEKFIFEESNWFFVNIANLLWRYGLSIFHIFSDVNSMLHDFSRIYKIQQKGYAYTSVDLLLNSMNPTFTKMTQTTVLNILMEKGYPQLFVEEFVQPIMLVNYGQTNEISGFAGFVSLAGADNVLYSIEGGNVLIPEGLFRTSQADFTKAEVTEVELLPEGKFSLKYKRSSALEQEKFEFHFDNVVVATPLIKGNTNIKFTNFESSFYKFEREFHQTVSTFVKGNLNHSAFNIKSIPDEILTNNETLLFNSISKCSPVDTVKNKTQKSIYKVFSKKPLSKESIGKLFKDVDIVRQKVWMAYPHYDPPEFFVPFILHPGLYYINAIESSASAMEMSAISAKNIALLIFNYWKDNGKKIDPKPAILKDEL